MKLFSAICALLQHFQECRGSERARSATWTCDKDKNTSTEQQTSTSSTSSQTSHAQQRLEASKNEKDRGEVSLEDEEHSFTSCFFGPQQQCGVSQ